MMTHTQLKRSFIEFLFYSWFLDCLPPNIGCAKKGLVTEKYSSEFYRVSKLLPDESIDKNPKFIIYADSSDVVLVTNSFESNVSAIDVSTRQSASDVIPVGSAPRDIAATSDGGKIYVADSGDDSVSVLRKSTGINPCAERAKPFGLR